MSHTHDPVRRRFLSRVTVAAGTIAAGSPLVALAHGRDEDGDWHEWRGQRRLIRPGGRFFPQSVASFEPRTRGVIVWTRVEDGDHPDQDLDLTLLVGTDPWLRRVVVATRVNARAADGGVVQVKLDDLKAKTRYYYRFAYEKRGRWYGSPIGRTLTAPHARDAGTARFLLASCQDAVGRFYNPYVAMLAQDPDFVLFIGDYIYETTGDPGFQVPGGRRPQFSDLAGAIRLGTAAAPFHAAASLSNYRELYRFYRSDPLLQRMHERFAFVHTWDDHEYSDDCWQANGAYTDGRSDENSPQRRRNAEQAFFEYVAVDESDVGEGQVDLSDRELYPNGRLYRDFRYGRNLHVALTDARSYRPDHLIPEDAFPGAVPVDRATLTAVLAARGIPYEAVKAAFAPYIDLATPPFAPLAPLLGQVIAGAYLQQGVAPAEAAARAQALVAAGKLDVRVVNALLGAIGQPPLPITDSTERGISFAHMGKTAFFSSLGSRYLVAKDTYDIYAAVRGLQNPASQDVYDASRAPAHPQLDWLKSVLMTSDARWKLVANSTPLTGMVLDLTGTTPGLPPAIAAAMAQLPPDLRNRFYLNVDQMDGFPAFKAALLGLYGARDDVALLSGDIHGSFVAQHAGNVWEFTGPAVSSFAFRSGLLDVVRADPVLSQVPAAAELIGQLDLLLALANAEIRYANTGVNGAVMVEAGANKLTATYWQIDGAEATRSYYEHPLQLLGKLKPRRFEIGAERLAEVERLPVA